MTMQEALKLLLLQWLLVAELDAAKLMQNAPFQNQRQNRDSSSPDVNESEERWLKRMLLRNYDSTSRPVIDDNDTVQLDIGLSLFHLLDTNERQQIVRAVYSFRFAWTDSYLVWNNQSVSRINVPVDQIWHPDVLILNTAEENLKKYMVTNAIVKNDGSVLWMVPHTATTTCLIDARYYPFDEQICDIVFVSWTYAGAQLNLTFKEDGAAANYYSAMNQEWEITKIEVKRTVKTYACCPNDVYPSVIFKMHMNRRGLFYVVNFVLPTLLLYFLALIGFLLPDAEKVNMQTTILLTLVILLMMLSDMMPPTSDRIPMISLFFIGILLLVAIAIIMSVISSHLSNRRHYGAVPRWGLKVIYAMNCSKHYQLNLHSTDGNIRSENNNNQVMISHSEEAPAIYLEKLIEDWQAFSAALDKLFFYLFLALSIVLTLSFVVLLSPAYSSNHDE